jgi:membrane fusion protein (multidrug efflux system)
VVLIAGAAACGGEEGNAGQQAGAMRGGNRRAGGPGDAGGMMGMMGGEAAIPVEARSVDRGDIAVSLQTYTTIEAERHVDVIARTQGLVKTIYVEEGNRVTEGQPLAQLDDAVLKLQTREREISLQSQKTAFDRAEELRAKEMLSAQEFEQARFQYEAAKTQYENARLNLEYSTIRSPFSGVITQRMIEVGNLVNANQPVFRAADFDPLLARIFIPERQIRQVRLGQAVRISVEGSERVYTGQVRMISPVVDPESGTVKVTVEVADRTNTLLPGMFATVNIITEVHENAVRIEKKALVSEAEGTYAFLFKGGIAEKTRLQLGESEGNWVEVLEGLAAGDSVITVGQEGLRNGAPVRIAGTPAAPMALGEMRGGGREQQGGEQRMRGGNSPGMQGGEQGMQGGPPGGMQAGGRGGGMMDLESIKARMFQNPKIKEAFEKRAKEDPDFEKNEDKQRQFFREMFQQLRGGGGGGGFRQQ